MPDIHAYAMLICDVYIYIVIICCPLHLSFVTVNSFILLGCFSIILQRIAYTVRKLPHLSLLRLTSLSPLALQVITNICTSLSQGILFTQFQKISIPVIWQNKTNSG